MNAEFTELLRPFLKFAGPDEITEESRLRDLGLDSMREIELLFAIEDTFGVSVPDDKLVDSTFATAGGLWGVVEELRAPVGGGSR
ncbi:phosphopantetheine-binding protein [Micromonospora tulbaghiae]|uniref:phosphopantetheine-binding protein n=1 Tax=Micromonospora tulbaghiae TaxID=479978 RepID=UPI0034337318